MRSRIMRSLVCFSLIFVFLVPVSTGAAPDEPDAPVGLDFNFGGFGSNGAISGLPFEPMDVAVDSLGRVVMVGRASNTFAVMRLYGPRLSLISTRTFKIDPAQSVAGATSVAIAPNGKIVITGYVYINGVAKIAYARLNDDLSLDASFDFDGVTWFNPTNFDNQGNDVVLQDDGKIVVAAFCATGATDYRWCVTRLTVDGFADTSFGGGNGYVIISFADNFAGAGRVLIQPDDKILVGAAIVSGDIHLGLARLNPDGSLDSSFDGDGKLSLNFGAKDIMNGMALTPDDKIVVVGHGEGLNAPMYIARFNSNGSLDSSFDGDGKLSLTLAPSLGGGRLEDVVVRPDGRIIAGGTNYRVGGADRFLLMRFNLNGSLDPSFDEDGMVLTEFGTAQGRINAITLQPDGMLVAAGASMAARYFQTGALDVGGVVTAAFDPVARSAEAQALAQQKNGQIVAAGAAQLSGILYDMAVTRLAQDGETDLTFGNRTPVNGRTIYGFGADERLYAVAIQKDGKIVAAGQTKTQGSLSQGNMMVARLNTDGKPDSTCTFFGFNAIDFNNSDDTGYALAVAPDGKIYVGGTVEEGPKVDFGVLRFNPDCTLDTSYAAPSGKARIDTGLSDVLQGMALQTDGKVVVAGLVGVNLVLSRLNAAGTGVDPSFGTAGFTVFDTGKTEIPTRMVQQLDGKLVVSGWIYDGVNTVFFVARFTPDGAPDTTFSGDGYTTIDFGTGGTQNAYGLAVRPDNTIAVVGCVGDTQGITRMGVAQLTPAGELDPAFNNTGLATLRVNSDGSDCANAALFAPPNRLIIAGTTYAAGKGIFTLASFETSTFTDTAVGFRVFLPVMKK